MSFTGFARNCGFLCVLGAATLTGLPAAAAAVPESDEPIRLTLNDWTGQNVSTRLMGSVLEEMGYEVDYVQADYIGPVHRPEVR
ncbi:MAG: glycine betaine ABC transporter substrate-binding protein [Arhodomonas sp.]|nr:glycine betaine ABC transporter substrate-binding protein [Arhodomonas sp.]